MKRFTLLPAVFVARTPSPHFAGLPPSAAPAAPPPPGTTAFAGPAPAAPPPGTTAFAGPAPAAPPPGTTAFAGPAAPAAAADIAMPGDPPRVSASDRWAAA